ncbi:hypothetical protein pEaSNUABM46_00234 [Erwinia phage pEa_SNUABM_46]|nr:hypothetical protein pEaSNUABM45_00234 [Erwinia phage pEa_SNUABM_45]QYW04218.1 hypothetical protein pEaSNUABM46_00234 [Erwinia phage pEa_SNUABM_46]
MKTKTPEEAYEEMRDILIAIQYMCVKRMVFPIVTARIEQKNGFLVMHAMRFNVSPKKFFEAIHERNGQINCVWLLRAFTRTAISYGLKPVIVEKLNEYQAFSSRFFDHSDVDLTYRRQYDYRELAILAEHPKPRIYTLNGVDYDGVQIPSKETQEVESRERSGS